MVLTPDIRWDACSCLEHVRSLGTCPIWRHALDHGRLERSMISVHRYPHTSRLGPINGWDNHVGVLLSWGAGFLAVIAATSPVFSSPRRGHGETETYTVPSTIQGSDAQAASATGRLCGIVSTPHTGWNAPNSYRTYSTALCTLKLGLGN